MAKKKPVKQVVKSKQSKKGIKHLYQVIAVIALLALIFFLVFPDIFKKDKPLDEYTFKKEGELTFYSENNEQLVRIDIEIADNEYERQLGVMKRKTMKEKEGMLFIFPDETMRSFWMRNTFISLDMIFVNANKEIVTIHKNTRTVSDQSYPSSAPAVYVVEVIAGFTDKYSISEGDKISWMDTKL
ncbi:MAG: DUF192 domain-containing protein [Ignavibacteria bacterium]|nr:DUF192 domain-containing protein [Ignavibacteria bacterium]